MSECEGGQSVGVNVRRMSVSECEGGQSVGVNVRRM